MEKYSDVLDYDGTQLGASNLIPLKIDVRDFRPIGQRAYRAPIHKRKIMDNQISEEIV